MSYVVYWTDGGGRAQSEKFTKDQMKSALDACEGLRKAQREGLVINHICLCSENPDSVTKMGVDVTDATYDWKKRR